MVIVVVLSEAIDRAEAHLLRWRPAEEAPAEEAVAERKVY